MAKCPTNIIIGNFLLLVTTYQLSSRYKFGTCFFLLVWNQISFHRVIASKTTQNTNLKTKMQYEPNMTIRKNYDYDKNTFVCICPQNQMWTSCTYINIIFSMENNSPKKKKKRNTLQPNPSLMRKSATTSKHKMLNMKNQWVSCMWEPGYHSLLLYMLYGLIWAAARLLCYYCAFFLESTSEQTVFRCLSKFYHMPWLIQP